MHQRRGGRGVPSVSAMRAYLCQEPYPRDQGAVEDVRPSSAAGGDVLVSSHSFDLAVEREKKKSERRREQKKKKLALRLCRRCQAHTHTLFSFFFFEKIEPHSSSTFSPWEVGSPNKKHEAPRAAASLAAGLVERRRRACCGSSNSSRGRISNSSSNMRRRRERELAFCFFFCSASRGDQVRVLAFFVLLVSPLESLRLALSVARAFFAKLVRVAARERGRGIRQMLRFSFSTTPSAFFFFPFVCFARPSTSQALSLPPNVSPSLSLLETRLEELLLSIAARMSD